MRRPQCYRVIWMTDLDAADPLEAARLALRRQRDPRSTALAFDVLDATGATVRVDLLARPARRPRPAPPGLASTALVLAPSPPPRGLAPAAPRRRRLLLALSALLLAALAGWTAWHGGAPPLHWLHRDYALEAPP